MGLELNVRSAAYAPPPGGEPTVGITWNWDL
jgi:hypothetical protein